MISVKEEMVDGFQVNATVGYVNNFVITVPLGVTLVSLSLLTVLGNVMVIHAIRTERKLRTVSISRLTCCFILRSLCYPYVS